MKSNRLEAFSDGVIAIIITIMVLELKAPEDVSLKALLAASPVFISYLLSFIYIGIFWNNHHHLFQITKKVNGNILWANLHFLFWLSLIPFSSSWLGEHHLTSLPVAFYGFSLLMCGVAFYFLQVIIIRHHNDDILKNILGKGKREKMSLVIYSIGILASFVLPIVGMICYLMVALLWIIPDKRIENVIS